MAGYPPFEAAGPFWHVDRWVRDWLVGAAAVAVAGCLVLAVVGQLAIDALGVTSLIVGTTDTGSFRLSSMPTPTEISMSGSPAVLGPGAVVGLGYGFMWRYRHAPPAGNGSQVYPGVNLREHPWRDCSTDARVELNESTLLQTSPEVSSHHLTTGETVDLRMLHRKCVSKRGR